MGMKGSLSLRYSVVIIYAYLPSGSTATEVEQYRDTVDIVHEITLKYSEDAKVIWVGDLNGA